MTATPPPLPPNDRSSVPASLATPRSKPNSSRISLGLASGACGFGAVVGAIIVALWARSHSPHIGFMEMMAKVGENPEHWVLKEPFYSALMALVAITGLAGLVGLVFGIVLVSISLSQKK